MNDSDWTPDLPPVLHTAEGEVRRVGVELELIGIDIDALSSLVAEHVDGEVERVSADEHVVHAADGAEWGVELDFELLKKLERDAAPEPDTALERIEEAARELLRAGARQVVPLEVVGPPVPMPRLGVVQSLVERLRAAGARGTRDRMINAFGLQLNPEMPALDADTILRYLRAFLCLEDWLIERAGVDTTRELTRFAAPFPTRYVRRVVAADYAPDLAALIDDHLADNPTRNRTLDLLPLFLHVDPERVRAIVEDPRVKPRPTLHYRLPNCEIDDPGWGVHVAWNGWLHVERLAADAAALSDLCARYEQHLSRPLDRLLHPWRGEVDAWLRAPGDR